MKKNWKLLNLEKNATVSEKLLKNRGLTGQAAADFMNPARPTIDLALSEQLFPRSELERSGQIIAEAINQKRVIIVHGDYDVDGLCAAAILWQTIYRDLGYKNCFPFIPNRFEHGYGLSEESLKDIALSVEDNFISGSAVSKKNPLIVTADCGVTAVGTVERAQDLGFSVLVLDHHTKDAQLPDCPLLWTDKTCAAGISWLVSQSLTKEKANYLELAALAVVADLQPLIGFNRSLVKFGIEKLNRTRNAGLISLIKTAGLSERKIGTFEIGWILAPRLNASGRLDTALASLRLLCTRSVRQAEEIAAELNAVNAQRQGLTKSLVELAEKEVEKSSGGRISVAIHEQFHEGVIGLVAGKLVSKYGFPAVVISKGEEVSRASARSVEGFNIVEFLRSLGDHFENIGGHAGAAGFTIRNEKIDDFLESVEEKQRELELPTQLLKAECELELENINREFFEEINSFAPFGIGNTEPQFLSTDVTVEDLCVVGNGSSHLKLFLNSVGTRFPAMFFGRGDLADAVSRGSKIDLIYSLSEDSWNGRNSLTLRVKDLDFGGAAS